MFFWRRVRGVLGTASTWFVSWAGLGAIYLAVDVASNYWRVPAVRHQLFSGLVAMGLFWGVWGAVSGIVYGVSVAGSQRRRSISELRARNLAMLGALSGAAYPGLVWVSSMLRPGVPVLADLPLAVVLGATAGSASAAATLWIARRTHSVSGVTQQLAINPGLEDTALAKRAFDAVHR
jgi:hypothetical protein